MGQKERRRQAAQQARQRARRRTLAVGVATGLAAVGALVGVLGATGSSGTTDTATYDRASHRLAFDLPAFHGPALTQASVAGTPTVINFYASWCTVCQHELPAFEAAHQHLGNAVTFLGVNPQSNDDDNKQAELIASSGVTYRTLRDHSERLLGLFNTTGSLPTTIFLSPSGTVVGVHQGGLDQAGLEAQIASTLGVSA